MFRAPAAYIIGAAKSGTTTLADLLAAHPDVGLSEPKEPDYFGGAFHNGIAWYAHCFDHVRDKRVLLDASTSYAAALHDAPCDQVAFRIRKARPDARIVFILRDPVIRAWSSYWHSVRAGEEHRPFEDALDDGRSVHITAGLYHARISEFLRHFSRHAMLLINFRDLTRTPHAVARKVAYFLDVDPNLLPSDTAQASRRNVSFQWNPLGRFFAQNLGLDRIRDYARIARAVLPTRAYDAARELVSQRIPTLPVATARTLTGYFAEDAADLAYDFGLDVREGSWWQVESDAMPFNRAVSGTA